MDMLTEMGNDFLEAEFGLIGICLMCAAFIASYDLG